MPPVGFEPTISAGELRLRQRGHWDRHVVHITSEFSPQYLYTHTFHGSVSLSKRIKDVEQVIITQKHDLIKQYYGSFYKKIHIQSKNSVYLSYFLNATLNFAFHF